MYSSTHFQSFLTRSRANAVSFQWTADVRLLSRLVEQTPLRYECLGSFYVVFTFRGIKLTGGYEVASDLIVLASYAVVYVAVAQFRYGYHLTTGSVSASGGLLCLVPPGTRRSDISAMSMPTLRARQQSMHNNRHWFIGFFLLSLHLPIYLIHYNKQ